MIYDEAIDIYRTLITICMLFSVAKFYEWYERAYNKHYVFRLIDIEPGHSISYKVGCAPHDSGQPAHPHILRITSIVRLKKAWMFGYP